jgi:hypothetical protein
MQYYRLALLFNREGQALPAFYGPIILPTIADLCDTLVRTAKAFPGETLYLTKLDLVAWYKHIFIPHAQAPLFCHKISSAGVLCIVLPMLVNRFESQVANYSGRSNYV